jgi:Na+-transporting methylmalonyl-CoA/oxaloacetate decarboxylase beta subunit
MIFGGADGPTTVYINGQTPPYLITAIFALLTIGGIAYRSFILKGAKIL